MGTIQDLMEIDFTSWLLTGLMIFSAFIAIYEILGKISKIIGKPLGFIKTRENDHELIAQNKNAIQELAKLHEQDTQLSNEHDAQIREELKQSLEMQKELTNSIKSIAEANFVRDKQVDSLMIGQREMLADKINRKYKYYISINGIPEDEVDEFTNLYKAYKGCGGNSSGDAKFEYCMNHLPILPIETKLIIKHE